MSQVQRARSPSSFVRSRGQQRLTSHRSRVIRRGEPTVESTRGIWYALLRCKVAGSQGTNSFGQDLDTPVCLFQQIVSCASFRHFDDGDHFIYTRFSNTATKLQPRVLISKLGSKLSANRGSKGQRAHLPYSCWEEHADFDHMMLDPAAAYGTDTCLTMREVLSSNMFAAIGSPEQ